MACVFRVVIPARFDSSRLPGKPLLPLAGKPCCSGCTSARAARARAEVIVATDDERIATAARGFGADVVMTARTHHVRHRSHRRSGARRAAGAETTSS